MKRTLNGLLACGFNKPTVYKIHVFDFDDVKDYTYTDDNLDLITGYSAQKLPVTYKPNKNGSLYNATQERSDTALFLHQLTLSFPKLTESGRNELIGLKSRDLTVIIEDANGKAWIMGKDFPVRFRSLALQIGTSNDYTLVLESTEKEQLKKIVPPDEDCFGAFYVEEEHISKFYMTPISAYTWNSFAVSANGETITYNPTSSLNPQYWNSIPVTKLLDEQKMIEFFSMGGNITGVSLEYLYRINTVEITVYSSDTRFDNLFVGGSLSTNEDYDVFVRFHAVLSPNLQNSGTTIRLTDSVEGEIYTDVFGADITSQHPNVSGTSENSYFKVTDDANDHIFTVDIPTHPTCPTASYTYRHKTTVEPCPLVVDLVDYYKGNKQYITIGKNTYTHSSTTGDQPPTFQRIEMNMNGTVYRLLWTPDKFTSDISVLENEIKTAVSQAGGDFIDVNSITVVDSGNYVRVYFETFGVSPNFTHPHYRGDSHGLGSAIAPVNGWKQSRVLGLNTAAPIGSFVKHNHSGGSVEGNYLVDVTAGDVEATPNTNSNSIDKVGIVWAFDENYSFLETEEITTEVTAECTAPNVTTPTSKCWDGYTSNLNGSYFTASISTKTIKDFPHVVYLVVDGVGYRVAIPATVTALENHHIASHAFKTANIKGLDLFDFIHDSIHEVWLLKFIASKNTTVTVIADLTNLRPFSFSPLNAVFKNAAKAQVNPYQKISWSGMPTISPFGSIQLKDMTEGEFHYVYDSEKYINMTWDGSTSQLTIDRVYFGGDFENQPVRFDFYTLEHNPFGDNAVIAQQATLGGGVNQIVVDLSVSFADKSTGLYTVLTNEYGEKFLNYTNIDTAGTIQDGFYFTYLDYPLVWGTRDALFYLGTGVTTSDPTVQSTVCNGVIIGNATITTATMTQDAVSEKVKITATVTGSDRLLIDSGSVSVDAFDNGNEAQEDGVFTLVSDNGTAATFETQLIEFSEPSEVVGYSYGLEMTFVDVGLLTVVSGSIEVTAEG